MGATDAAPAVLLVAPLSGVDDRPALDGLGPVVGPAADDPGVGPMGAGHVRCLVARDHGAGDRVLTAAPNAWPAWAHVGITVSCAVVMGLIVGLLTGRTLRQLLACQTDDRGVEAGLSALPLWRAGMDDDMSDRAGPGSGEHPPADVVTP